MGEKTEKIERIEKNKGRTMNEIIIDMEKGTGSSSQVSRILDSQTEMMAKRLERSNMEQLLAESERKRLEEDMRLKETRDGKAPPPLQPPQTSQEAKTILEAVKIGVEVAKPQKSEGGSIGEIIKGMADMFKTGVEIGSRSSQSQQQPQQNSLEMMKQYNDMFLKPVLDQLNSKDKEMMMMRMNQIENKITTQVSPQDYIKQVKESAATLGLTGGGKSDIDLKLAEMGQLERLENRKIDWEQQKHLEDKEGERELYALIGKAIDGPVADLTKSLGGAAAKRIESGTQKNRNNQTPTNPQLTQIDCPQCTKPFSIITGAQQVVCPNCQAILGLQQSPPPQQAPPPPTQTQEQQPPEATQQTEQPEQKPAEAPEPVQSEQPKQ